MPIVTSIMVLTYITEFPEIHIFIKSQQQQKECCINSVFICSWNDDFFLDETSLSQPNLCHGLDVVAVYDYRPYRDRFDPLYPHEYITVDDLNYYRRRKPSDCYADEHLKSHFSLHNQSEPSIPYATSKSEYKEHFQEYEYKKRIPFIRRHTTLRIESGTMDKKSEHHANYVPYTTESIAKSRPPLIKHSETLKTFNGSKRTPEYSEYRSSFLPYKLTDFLYEPKKISKMSIKKEAIKLGELSCSDSTLHNKKKAEKSNLRLTGETMLDPEYKTKYIPFSIEKSQSTPQLNNINFTGNFSGMPSEYKECYKSYDHFTKSAPIKKLDNLSLSGLLDLTPEYKDRFQNPLLSRCDRPSYLKREDNLHLDGDFVNRMPEYCSSYRNPNIIHKPEKAKPKDTILHLEGGMSYEPIYRCSYIDFPRNRPVINKPECNIKLETSVEPNQLGFRKHRSRIPVRSQQHAFTDEELAKFEALPEYRKAKRELMIKPRPLSSNKSTLAQQIHNEKNKVGLRQDGQSVSSKITPSDDEEKIMKKTPSFKFMVENIDDNRKLKLHQEKRSKSPILAIQRENGPVELYNKPFFKDSKSFNRRNRTNVIESNVKYAKNASDQYRHYQMGKAKNRAYDEQNVVSKSFVVLNAPVKQKNKHWLGPTTIYDSKLY
ncbi:uncharacterized protein LOC110676410 isoform X2 [Aedes aegypti]|uniref:Uncharacterized protein n=1 Tax=Aedes aegypti TaxID=7159 RepID=A0A6I8U0W1_AEDAE|nr:uncharacterized protein LOC110676410 isoform X2 [Aedes aegypti]